MVSLGMQTPVTRNKPLLIACQSFSGEIKNTPLHPRNAFFYITFSAGIINVMFIL